jgi:pimeloyl-ACP methyl ester carboxylesterase
MAKTWRNLPDSNAGDLGRIGVPTLVVACDRDELLSHPDNPLEVFEQTAHAVPGAEMVVIRGAHFAPVERPREVNSAILEFLGTNL